jgi:hypothetical protein
MFEPGFPAHKRLVNFGYKGVIFSSIGLLAGIIGTATSNGLLELRKVLDPTFVTKNEAPNILFNAMTWSAHMGVSSNLRQAALPGAAVCVAPCAYRPPPPAQEHAAGLHGTGRRAGGPGSCRLNQNRPCPPAGTRCWAAWTACWSTSCPSACSGPTAPSSAA